MNTSADLVPSPLWQQYQREIRADLDAGVPYADSFRMNCAIKMRDLAPYAEHRKRLDALLWRDDPGPKRIIDLGAGYGAMASVWPKDARIINIDLPELLAYQREYVDTVGDGNPAFTDRFGFVPISEADSVDFRGAYLFSAWALTETTLPTWRYYIDRAPQLAGAYILGHRQWGDEAEPWPWSEMLRAFTDIREFRPVVPESWELAAVNR